MRRRAQKLEADYRKQAAVLSSRRKAAAEGPTETFVEPQLPVQTDVVDLPPMANAESVEPAAVDIEIHDVEREPDDDDSAAHKA